MECIYARLQLCDNDHLRLLLLVILAPVVSSISGSMGITEPTTTINTWYDIIKWNETNFTNYTTGSLQGS